MEEGRVGGFEQPKILERVEFLTDLGFSTEDVNVNFGEKDLSFRQLFDSLNADQEKIKEVLAQVRLFKEKYPENYNGTLLGNPILENVEGAVRIRAERIKYFVYFGILESIKEGILPVDFSKKYMALSVCGVGFDETKKEFILFRRADDSAEDPGLLDAPGGTLDPNSQEKANPQTTINDRLRRKINFTSDTKRCVGIARMRSKHYSLTDIMYIAFTQNPDVRGDRIPLRDCESVLTRDTLTLPAKVNILLALAQREFEAFGWDRARVQSLRENLFK